MDPIKLKIELATHIEARKAERDLYQMNIDNYTLLLKKLPDAWPEDLIHFQGKTVEQIIDLAVEGQNISLIADLVFRDKIVISLKHELLQQRVSLHMLDVLTERHAAIPLDAAEEVPSTINT